MSSEENINKVVVQPVNKEKVRAILKVALILFVLTVVEFIIAFLMNAGAVKTSIFVIMTIVKAFYIVGEFMHLKHESKVLIWSIILPTLFISWLLVALLNEGSFIYSVKF